LRPADLQRCLLSLLLQLNLRFLENTLYDCAIIGGGIAGLSLSVLLARAGKRVILFEQRQFPFHKVSGGYFSNEGIPFLASLGIDLRSRGLPSVERMMMSSPSGRFIDVKLDIGGVGISRYEIDHELYHIALGMGVEIRNPARVKQVQFDGRLFRIMLEGDTFLARTAAGAFGRSSNMDAALGRDYKVRNEQQLFVAVEHHIRIPFRSRFVEIHAFPGGYCGISAYGDGMVNLSYTTKAATLKAYNGIQGLEREVLSANIYLGRYFREGAFLLPRPQTISHVFFLFKQAVAGHMLMVGDTAGTIAPISGNGMSIAVHSAKLAGEAIMQYLEGRLSLAQMEERYRREYHRHFARRIKVSKQLHHLLVNPVLTNAAFPFFRRFPFLVDYVSRQIHGSTI